MKPTILVLTTARWPTTVRLGIAFAEAGCIVDGLCPPGHPFALTKAVRRIYSYRALAPVSSICEAIARSAPDLLVPTDDLATQHLLEIWAIRQQTGDGAEHLGQLIERSLGSPQNYPLILQRTKFIKLALTEGVRAPETDTVNDLEELRNRIERTGLPVVIKADETSSGEGVCIARSIQDASRAFRVLQAPPALLVVIKRAVFNRDKRWIRPWWKRTTSTINVQAYVAGREATSTVACWHGRVLASLHFEVLEKRDPQGPASVLRLLNRQCIATAVEKIVRRLCLSGIHGFDFILEESTGHAYLIEMNPRATQVGHLALGPGRDLVAALTAAVSGYPMRNRERVTEKETVALFPQEWLRNPASPYLSSGYHDVPLGEPALIRHCIRRRRGRWYAKQMDWLYRLLKASVPGS